MADVEGMAGDNIRIGTSGRTILMRGIPAALAVLAVTACSQVPPGKSSHSKIDPVLGVEAPKKMVADGQPVPPGGGRYQVGKPYMVGGRMYFPHEDANYDKVGSASWYGHDDHGRETANGEVYDKESLSAAHPTLPIPSYARVTNLDNGRSVLVRINDRGPYVGDRLVDVSERTADLLGFKGRGLGHVRLQYVGPAPVEGSDQRMLVASLRGPGAAASIAQDRSLIAQRDRSPSDGRMTGLALANLFNKPEDAPKPTILASATEAETSYTPAAPRPVVSSRQVWNAPPPPPRQQAAPQIAIAPAQPVAYRSALPSNTFNAVPSHNAPQYVAARPFPAGGASTLAPLPPEDDEPGPLKLAPARSAPAAPGAIARLPGPAPAPVTPSRYGPNGQIVYKFVQTQGFLAQTRQSPAADAIDHLIAIDAGPTAPKIDLGSYAHPENAARVAELMQPYGAVTTTAVRSGLGEKLIVVKLAPSTGLIPGNVVSIADRLGIHAATLID